MKNGRCSGNTEGKQKEATSKTHEAKHGGRWALCKEITSNSIAPLIALKKQQKGQQKATQGNHSHIPAEIDAIIRKAYVSDQHKETEECPGNMQSSSQASDLKRISKTSRQRTPSTPSK